MRRNDTTRLPSETCFDCPPLILPHAYKSHTTVTFSKTTPWPGIGSARERPPICDTPPPHVPAPHEVPHCHPVDRREPHVLELQRHIPHGSVLPVKQRHGHRTVHEVFPPHLDASGGGLDAPRLPYEGILVHGDHFGVLEDRRRRGGDGPKVG